jgi:heavy metal sensor kinase
MNLGLARGSIRLRLTLWYAGILALLLTGFALASYFTIAYVVSSRTDQTLAEIADAFADTVSGEHQEDKAEAMNAVVREVLGDLRFRGYRFAVYDNQARLVATSTVRGPGKDDTLLHSLLMPSSKMVALLALAERNGSDYATFLEHRQRIRAYVSWLHGSDEDYMLVALRSLNGQQRMLDDLSGAFLAAVPLTLLLACAGGYWLARKGLAPVLAMARQAQHISATNLDERLPVVNPDDELGTLARTFNELLARLNDSFEHQRRFMADASHELRTPVAIVRGEAEVTLARSERTPDEYREALKIIGGESRRLTQAVDDLFLLSRADVGQIELVVREFYLDELVQECVRALRTVAEAKGVAVRYVTGGEMLFRGDETFLRRMILNLLDNAIKYTPRSGRVEAGCEKTSVGYRVMIADNGCGISADAQPHIFERFYRADIHHSESGAGLGLPIARWIAEAHGGHLELVHSDSGGSVFEFTLPWSALR